MDCAAVRQDLNALCDGELSSRMIADVSVHIRQLGAEQPVRLLADLM